MTLHSSAEALWILNLALLTMVASKATFSQEPCVSTCSPSLLMSCMSEKRNSKIKEGAKESVALCNSRSDDFCKHVPIG